MYWDYANKKLRATESNAPMKVKMGGGGVDRKMLKECRIHFEGYSRRVT